MFDSYALDSWDKVSLIACQAAQIEALVFNINSKKRIPYPVQTDFHPYRNAIERKKPTPIQQIQMFASVAEAFNKGLQ